MEETKVNIINKFSVKFLTKFVNNKTNDLESQKIYINNTISNTIENNRNNDYLMAINRVKKLSKSIKTLTFIKKKKILKNINRNLVIWTAQNSPHKGEINLV